MDQARLRSEAAQLEVAPAGNVGDDLPATLLRLVRPAIDPGRDRRLRAAIGDEVALGFDPEAHLAAVYRLLEGRS